MTLSNIFASLPKVYLKSNTPPGAKLGLCRRTIYSKLSTSDHNLGQILNSDPASSYFPFNTTTVSGCSPCGRERLNSDSRVASDHQNRHRLHRHNIGLKLCFETGFVNCIWSQIHFGQRRKNVGQRHRVLSIVFVFAYLCRVFACNTPKDVFPRVCVRMFIWWWWWRFWWSKATRLLESSRSRLDLRPRQKQNGKKDKYTNTKTNTLHCALCSRLGLILILIFFQIIHLQITIWAKFKIPISPAPTFH